jgi:hypothetical protein
MVKLQLISTAEKSHNTLCSQVSSDETKNFNNDHCSSDNDSEFAYSESDITLVEVEDKKLDPKNDAEKMFFQVMEVLRFEQEVKEFYNCEFAHLSFFFKTHITPLRSSLAKKTFEFFQEFQKKLCFLIDSQKFLKIRNDYRKIPKILMPEILKNH